MKEQATLKAPQDWRDQAECRDLDVNLFFPVSEEDEAPAKDVCAVCPVREECLDWAIATRQSDGIWGGLNETERRRERRRRQAGRAVA